MTALIPILSTLLLDDFSKASHFRGQGPKTFQERLFLISVYIPYFLIPLILLLFMVRNPYYKSEEKRKKKWKKCPQGQGRGDHWAVSCWTQYQEQCSEPMFSVVSEPQQQQHTWARPWQEAYQTLTFQGLWHRRLTTWGRAQRCGLGDWKWCQRSPQHVPRCHCRITKSRTRPEIR